MDRPLTILKMLVVPIWLAAIPGAATAQDQPNFTGTWSLVAEQSDFGPAAVPEKRVDVIEHEGESMAIERTQTTSTGEVTVNLAYKTDGESHSNTIGAGEMSSVLTWEGVELVITSTLSLPQGEISVLDRMSLSEDGQTVTISRRIAVQGQELLQTLVMAKQ